MTGLTQTQLATAGGVTFQQVQKYERGTNRVSASLLYTFSRVLHCSPAAFFEGLDEVENVDKIDLNAALGIDGAPQLLRAFRRLTKRDRNTVLTLVKALSN